MKTAYDVILKPVITEASIQNMHQRKYTFRVATGSTKPEIAHAVEKLFGVKVSAVNTINMKRKPKRLRMSQGYTSEWKKAVVTLTADSKPIEFFEGMY